MTTPPVARPPGGPVPPAPVPGGQPAEQPDASGAGGRLRQLAWASVPIWSLSTLASAPFLRLALARKRARDWGVFAGYLAASILTMVVVSVDQAGEGARVVAGFLVILLGLSAAVHSFVAFAPPARAPGRSRASKRAVATARARMHRRQQARELAERDPVLARELGIGRPDVPHDYDDGGLVDVNHAPGDVLASSLLLTAAESASLVEVRDRLGRFSGPKELTAYTELTPERVEALRDLMMFG